MMGLRTFLMLAALSFVVPDTWAANMTLDPSKVAAEKVKLIQGEDKFQGYKYLAPKPKMLGGSGIFTSLYANPVFVQADNKSWFYFRVEYQGFGWLYLTGKVIFLLDDGSRIVLDDAEAKRVSEVESCTGAGGCLVSEYVRLPVLPADLQRIATAKSVEVAIYGQNNYVTAYFKPYHQAAVIEVLRQGEAKGGMQILPPNQ